MKSSTEDGDSGKIVNLLTNDLAKFDYAFFLIHEIWKGPLQSLLYLMIIYTEVGWSGVISLVFLLSFIPLQGNASAFEVKPIPFAKFLFLFIRSMDR